jgi:transposase-like protein
MKPATSLATRVSTISAPPSPTGGTEGKPRRRRRWTPAEKAKHLVLFAESGVSQAQFCRAMRVSAPTFSQWRRRTPSRGERVAGAPCFAEVCVTEPLPRSGTVPARVAPQVVLHLPGGVTCEAPVGADPVWLGQVLKALTA